MTYRYVKNKGEHIRIPACVLSKSDFCLTCFWTPKCTNVLDTFIKKRLNNLECFTCQKRTLHNSDLHINKS